MIDGLSMAKQISKSLDWNKLLHLGIIPSPHEEWDEYLDRIENSPIIGAESGHEWLEKRFGLAPTWARVTYSNKGLLPWEAAACFVDGTRFAAIHVRRSIPFGYDKSEVIAHELVHAVRAGFNEPRFEEFLASRVFTKARQRVFSALLEKPWEAILLLPLFPWLILRYLRKQLTINKLNIPFPILLALTDKEITQLARGTTPNWTSDNPREEMLRTCLNSTT